MISRTMPTGVLGTLRIDDKTDGPVKTVDVWIKGLTTAIPNLPWTVVINGGVQTWKSFNFQHTAEWQKLGTFYVGNSDTFALMIDYTGNADIGGPTEFDIDLFRNLTVKTVTIRVGAELKKAIAYVKIDGVWTAANAMVMSGGEWKQTS